MSLAQAYRYTEGGPFYGDPMSYWNRNYDTSTSSAFHSNYRSHYNSNYSHVKNFVEPLEYSGYGREYNRSYNNHHSKPDGVPSFSKKRKLATSTGEVTGRSYQNTYAYVKLPYRLPSTNGNFSSTEFSIYNNAPSTYENHSAVAPISTSDANPHGSTSHKRGRSLFEDGDSDALFLSRDEIERHSPSRKDGIDAMHETHLRFSYCAFLQNLGLQLELPHTTIATAMVLCHRFFVRQSHACHDRYLIATASLFLAAKSEETPRPLYNVLRVSCEILHNKDFTFLSYALPVDWFEKYRERVLGAEELILATLNFELNVQHPYASLTSTLEKLGFSEPFLVNLALSLVTEGLRSSLWLQFKPQQIAAGAAYLAAKMLHMDLASGHSVWKEFETPAHVLKDIAQQLVEVL
ncbi:OLC1v1020109C1 [Oldenlandia corymbosa var. corymbosa]|uniref:OLC1v1020109C1 n=1 Tax=Oldenlandia corymbosa var. corymbosa TaxID=529605 RepID=A0AAV1EFS1_OLDCO|nr:OLC1v1020109C1 [Oldenlandia corymbosa var. corymbosa]